MLKPPYPVSIVCGKNGDYITEDMFKPKITKPKQFEQPKKSEDQNEV